MRSTVNAEHPSPALHTAVVAGEEVQLPVEVRSATQVSATWVVDADVAQRIVAPTGLQVARLGPRRHRTTCSIAAVQYADNDLGPYNEIAVAFAVTPHDRPDRPPPPTRPVTYIHRLPVNAPFTCAAGRELWGFPKWMTDISYTRGRAATVATLVEEDGALALRVTAGGVPLPVRPLHMTSYSFLDGVLRRTQWTSTTHAARLRPAGASLHLAGGRRRVADPPSRGAAAEDVPGTREPVGAARDDRTAPVHDPVDGCAIVDELRELGVAGRRPLFAVSVGRMTASFGPAEVVTAPPP